MENDKIVVGFFIVILFRNLIIKKVHGSIPFPGQCPCRRSMALWPVQALASFLQPNKQRSRHQPKGEYHELGAQNLGMMEMILITV
jgi:hypothetical protein